MKIFVLILLLPGGKHIKVGAVADAAAAKAAYDSHPDKSRACSAFVGVFESSRSLTYDFYSQYQTAIGKFEYFDQNSQPYGHMVLFVP